MHRFVQIACLFLTLLMAGCGGPDAEGAAKKSLEAMKELTEAIEKGDKNLAMNVTRKLQGIVKDAKEMKVSQAENQRINEKYKTQIVEQGQKLVTAMMKAVGSGKLTQEEMKEIGLMMQQMK